MMGEEFCPWDGDRCPHAGTECCEGCEVKAGDELRVMTEEENEQALDREEEAE